VAEVDLSKPVCEELKAVIAALSSSWICGVISCVPSSRGAPTGQSAVPALQHGTAGESELRDVGEAAACAALDELCAISRAGDGDPRCCMVDGGAGAADDEDGSETRAGLGKHPASSLTGSGDTPGRAVAGGPAAEGDEEDAETAVADGEVEADGVPGNLASPLPGKIDAAASATVADRSAAIGDEVNTAVPEGTTSDSTGSGRVLPSMKDRTREGCTDRGADL
jgi:hypothetical protein